MDQPDRPAEEHRLDVFVGSWQNTGSIQPGAFGPGGAIGGSTTYKWAVGGRWLQYTSRLELPGMGRYEVHGGVAYNDASKKYDAYAANSLGALMVYEGEWMDGNRLLFLLSYPAPAGRARISYTIQPDGSIQMDSERLLDNGEFETYFQTIMKPVS